VAVEDFNRFLKSDSNPPVINDSFGTYTPSKGTILTPGADKAGGAGGVGRYFQVASGTNTVTLTFNMPQPTYFGLWWSNANPEFPQSNTLTFSLNVTENGHTKPESFSFNTGNLEDLIKQQPKPEAYLGNPNIPVPIKGTQGEFGNHLYAFVNFFALPDVTIKSVEFSNSQGQFSSDNHTIAASYPQIVGNGDLPPPPPGGPAVLPPGPTDIGSGGDVLSPDPVMVPRDSSLDISKGGEAIVDGSVVVAPGGEVKTDGTIMAGGPVVVAPGGEVTGDGKTTTPGVINDGIVMPTGPNGTPGTLTDNGNYQQAASGDLVIGIGGPKPSQADELKINGAASLNGTLDLMSSNKAHAAVGDTFEVLSATGGVKGNFSNVVDTFNTTGLTRADIITPNGAFVTYLPAGHGVLNLTLSTPLPASPSTAQLDAVVLQALDPNVEQLAAPFDIWFSLANTQRFNLEARFDDVIAGSSGFVSNITYPTPPPTGEEVTEGKGSVSGKETKETPLPPAPGCHWGVWVTGYGDFVNVGDEGVAKGYNYTNGGVTVGIDYRVTEHVVVGLMGGYAHTWTDLKPGSVDVDTGWGGLYAGYFDQCLYVLGAAFGGGNTFDTSRETILGGRADGSSDGQEFSTFLSAGYDFHFGHLTIGPTAAVQYSYVNIDGFSEHGSLAPMAVREDSQESWRTDLGFRAWYTFQVGRVGMRPFVRAAWEHEYKSLGCRSRLV
jgi:uncharacterized protein with beta-barrel porin domain